MLADASNLAVTTPLQRQGPGAEIASSCCQAALGPRRLAHSTAKLGTVSLDGTKIKANAIKHKALSEEHCHRESLWLRAR